MPWAGRPRPPWPTNRDGSLAELSWRKDSTADPALLRAHTAVAYDTGGLRRAETVQVAQPVGEITGASGPGTAATDHDTLDRLVRWVSPFPQPGTAAQPATAYSLDDGGNIEAEAKTAGATSWNVDPTYDHGRLASRTSTGPEATTNDVFSYTGLGEESSRTTTTAGLVPATATTATTYDPAGHTARVDQPGTAPDVDYVYDTADRLLARTEGLETTLYFYWGGGGTAGRGDAGRGDERGGGHQGPLPGRRRRRRGHRRRALRRGRRARGHVLGGPEPGWTKDDAPGDVSAHPNSHPNNCVPTRPTPFRMSYRRRLEALDAQGFVARSATGGHGVAPAGRHS